MDFSFGIHENPLNLNNLLYFSSYLSMSAQTLEFSGREYTDSVQNPGQAGERQGRVTWAAARAGHGFKRKQPEWAKWREKDRPQ